jgi:hypothetical protein
VTVYAFHVPNPYGVCCSGQVAVQAANRTEAVRRIRAAGLKPTRAAVATPLKLRTPDLAAITTDDEVWIRGVGLSVNGAFIDDDPWRPVTEFRTRYEETSS